MSTLKPHTARSGIVVDARPWRVDITAPDTFGLMAGVDLCERFLRRAFTLEAVRSIAIDREKGQATITHAMGKMALPGFLATFSAVLVGHDPPGRDRTAFLIPGNKFALFRHHQEITPWDVLSDKPGRLVLRREGLSEHRSRYRYLIASLKATPGLWSVRSDDADNRIIIRYDKTRWNTRDLLRLANQVHDGSIYGVNLPAIRRTPYGLAPVAVGLAASALFIPELLLASAALLAGMNVSTLREAYAEIRARQIGLPTLYSTIVATTLATGQFLPAALMTWFFRYWRRRFEDRLERVQLEFLVTLLPGLGRANRQMQDGHLMIGDLIVLNPEEHVPADATVIEGEGLVSGYCPGQRFGTVRKYVGDTLLAGSTVTEGRFIARVERVGSATRAAIIGQTLIDATHPVPSRTDRALTLPSERFANKAVPPTLLMAGGGGVIVGELIAAGAILRPDYATGVGIAGSIHTWNDLRHCLQQGVLIRTPLLLEKLAAARVIVLDDSLNQPGNMTVEALRDLHRFKPELRFVLVSNRSDEWVERMTRLPGLDSVQGGLDAAGQADVVRRYRAQAGTLVFIGDCKTAAQMAVEADVVIDTGPDLAGSADMHLLTSDLSPLATLWQVADRQAGRERMDRFGILVPNLFCIAGALTLGFTSLHAVILSNLGTLFLFSQATARLDRDSNPFILSASRATGTNPAPAKVDQIQPTSYNRR